MSQARVLALTEQIYDAAAGGTAWSTVGDGLKALVGANSAALIAGDVLRGQAEVICHQEIPDDAAAAYREHYRYVDLWMTRAARMIATGGLDRPRVLVSGEMLVPDSEFLRSEFYCDFGRRLGLRYIVGTVVPLGEAGMMPIGLHRPDGKAPFGAAERRLLEAVLPHLRRGMQLRHRLKAAAPEAAASPGAAALDALAVGVLVVDAEMRLWLANAAAEAMATGPAPALRLRRLAGIMPGAAPCTIVAPIHRGDAEALTALVQGTALGGRSGGALRLRNTEGEGALAVLAMPLPRRLAEDAASGFGRVQGRAMLLLRPVAAPSTAPRAELLHDLFGLTRAEAEVAGALLGGRTKRSVAAARGVGETTIRAQVRAVLEKTGATNLRDLERLLAGLQGQ
ncbi:hypothetical protein LPC08_14205 [Roseomonas sp. OT10]|uniref:helix-turn-helix transcriptional regulator n=1 Tax=Roseomonas cutis TaxID=2897332 RepID=UPI001E373EE0|nr:hypothetical protein [Roseomonas sp. OT10]UFN47180.1 hypothetical protein LPC08_14205 [Roseomonas sp. OT10]